MGQYKGIFLITAFSIFISNSVLFNELRAEGETSQLVSATENPDHHSEDIRQIQVLTLNLWDGGGAFGKYTDQRLKAVCQLFKEAYRNNGWDIILIQELWPIKERKDTLKDCGYPYILNGDRTYEEITDFFFQLITPNGAYQWLSEQLYNDRLDAGLRILSRYPMSNLKRHTYSENGSELRLLDTMLGTFVGPAHLDTYFFDLGKVGYTRDAEYVVFKSAMLVTVNHPDMGSILVANTHLISNFQGENYHEQRWLQLQELSEFVRANQDGHVATIVGGDFNVGPLEEGDENEYYKNSEYDWNIIMTDLFPDFYHATPLGECTYCYSSNQFATAEGGVNQSIDHILASPNLIVQSSAIVDEKATIGGNTVGRQTKIPLSDHYGVEVTFKLPEFVHKNVH